MTTERKKYTPPKITDDKEFSLEAFVEFKKSNYELVRMLKMVEWEGYNVNMGERACPCCERWKFQGEGKQPIHAYACGLAVLIGAPTEQFKEPKL